MLRLIIFLAAFPLFSFAASLNSATTTTAGREVATLNLKESILFAFDRDPAIGQQAAQMGIGQAQIDQASSGWMPQVSLNASGGRSLTTDSSGSLKNSAAYGLTLTQLVWDFGKTGNAIGQQKALYESYRFQLMATMTTVAEKTALGFIEVRRNIALEEALQENIKGLKSVLQMASLRTEAGLSSSSEVLQARTRLAMLQATGQQYSAALNSQKARLSVFTGIRAREYVPLPSLPTVDPLALENINYAQIPSVLAARAAETASRFAVDAAKSQHWPTLKLVGGRTRYQNTNSSYWDDQIQLNVEAPLYQGGAVSAQIRQAEGARTIAASQIEAARFEVMQKASVAQAEWSGAEARVRAAETQLNSARRSRQVYKNEYQLGKRTINDLLSAEQDVWQAASAKINAQYDSWSAAIAWGAAVDNLLPMLGIAKDTVTTLPELN